MGSPNLLHAPCVRFAQASPSALPLRISPAALICALTWLSATAAGAPASADRVSFNRQIRPILAEHCFACHGPDEVARKGKLRLDTRDGLFARGKTSLILAPGNLGGSALYQRITAANLDDRMPPLKHGKPLSDQQVAMIRAWIEQGARWEQHWSFISPVRAELPLVKEATWSRNPIDRFVLARLDREAIKPSPPAGKMMLLRRVTLDLTGLPPTPEELDAFLKDSSADAYEKVVDRLLASPRFGEAMAAPWLDSARFADTNGYNNDDERPMWPWRDWVINAFNENLPYDRFIIEQIAGDLLPHATLRQRIATAFNRNHVLTTEGGIIEEEYHVEYVVDRVNTTANVFLGLTTQCARCHDHKFDPITQKDFYSLFAFFNNLPDRAVAPGQKTGDPVMRAPSGAQLKELDQLAERRQTVQAALMAAPIRRRRCRCQMGRGDCGQPRPFIAERAGRPCLSLRIRAAWRPRII